MERASQPDNDFFVSKRQSSFSKTFEHGSISAEVFSLLDDVRSTIGHSPEGARTAALRLVTLLTPLAKEARGGLAPWQQQKIDRYLRGQLEQPLPVQKLADHIPLSVSHFCRAFKESYGITPHAHITGLRVERAQRLMLSTSDPLSQVALACGLADQAHLSKLFRRCVGETPTAWRRRNLTEAQVEARSGHLANGQTAD